MTKCKPCPTPLPSDTRLSCLDEDLLFDPSTYRSMVGGLQYLTLSRCPVTLGGGGSLASAATFCLISWAVVRRGPSYPPMFNPLTLIFVAVLEALILGAEITVGTLLGMVLIIIGLYSFLLGKTKEMTNMPKSSMEAATTVESTKVKPASPLTITNEDIESRSVKDSVNP
ncbi:hypothetical protein DKX38_018479 [Salix brachista]|uniref:WAT1-related protein n=1 Tax=Salix brachista TaxID=2182728 RepID=A0A5N5KN49_9ROSI|nr:hypothetical protein DKX38_018479 [Salix brachista]